MDDRIIGEPAGVLAQAILTSSFGAATTISEKHPETWKHRIRFSGSVGPSRKHRSNIGITRLCPSEFVILNGSKKQMIIENLIHMVTGEFWTIQNPTLPELVLMVGSYGHCRYVLQHLHQQRPPRMPSARKAHLASGEADTGLVNDWERCRLTEKEFWCLMLGNLIRERPDREALWVVIGTQVTGAPGFRKMPKSMVYLNMAIRYGSKSALVHMIDLGWQVNGPWWAYFMTPYRLATRTERTSWELEYLRDPDIPQWGNMDSHRGVYEAFRLEQAKLYQDYKKITKENSEFLESKGGKMPWFVLWFRQKGIVLWANIAYAVLYGILLPIILAFATGPYWAWPKPSSQKLAWAYLWSLAAVLNLPISWIWDKHYLFPVREILTVSLFTALLVLQHLLPLILIATVDFGQSGPGVNLGWVIPFVLIMIELGILALGCGVVAIGYAFAACFDACYVLVYCARGKGFRRGPFGII